LIRTLATVGATQRTIAAHCGISHDTLTRRYADVIEQARSDGQVRILGKLFSSAMAGHMRALELCAVNLCGWSTRPEVQVTTNVLQNLGEAVPESRLLEYSRQMSEFVRANEQKGVASPSEGSH
jgi:hypothetical protein